MKHCKNMLFNRYGKEDIPQCTQNVNTYMYCKIIKNDLGIDTQTSTHTHTNPGTGRCTATEHNRLNSKETCVMRAESFGCNYRQPSGKDEVNQLKVISV